MGIQDRVLPEDIEAAKQLEENRKLSAQTQMLLMKNMEHANREGNKEMYLEFHDLRKKEIEKEKNIEKQLSVFYMKKQRFDYERKEVLKIAKHLEEVGGSPEVVEKIRKSV